ncbi:hypothetical protein LINPERPRIM_LOCUS1531 [Linum perenne]
MTMGYSYSGVKGNIRVWNPHVEDDDYSLSHVSLLSGGKRDFENIRSGWMVNPKLYGDRQTRLFVYWTDPVTGNWWVEYGENVYLGYWPRGLFTLLAAGNAEAAEWGGEVYSTKLGKAPHTTTGMGSGSFADHISGNSGWVKRIRVRENSMELRYPEWASAYSDEYYCYDTYMVIDYIPDPEFYYGGPGRNIRWCL